MLKAPPGGWDLQLIDAFPDKASYKPGEEAHIFLDLENNADKEFQGIAQVRLVSLVSEIAQNSWPFQLPPQSARRIRIPLKLPAKDFHGYNVEVEVLDAARRTVATAFTALDVLSDWAMAPRYGFLADFSPEELDSQERIETLAKYHINVVQFYDWMYRHYQLFPPSPEFTDTLGRHLSLDTVRRKIDLAHQYNMAALAYGAVYGAEPEFFQHHPEWALYRPDGEPYNLDRYLYIMNIARGSPWRDMIIQEFRRAVTELPFDGLHLDQYGFPKVAFAYTQGQERGKRLYLSQHFPAFIDDVKRALESVKPGAKVIFNAVNNWPIEKVAPTLQDAVYIEVWPPHNTYNDLRRLILKGRKLGGNKQVILAAYLAPLKQPTSEAEYGALLASAAIYANGGFHLLLGERNAALCDPYYPNYALLRPSFVPTLRRYYDFIVCYEEFLFNPTLKDATGYYVCSPNTPCRSTARKNSIWAILRHKPGWTVLNLINLNGIGSIEWNAPKPRPKPLQDILVTLCCETPVQAVYFASPDRPSSRPVSLGWERAILSSKLALQFTVPFLDIWDLILIQHAW